MEVGVKAKHREAHLFGWIVQRQLCRFRNMGQNLNGFSSGEATTESQDFARPKPA